MSNLKRTQTKISQSIKCTINEEFDFEKNEITFTGKIKIIKDDKTSRRIMYLSAVNGTPAVAYFVKKKPLRCTNAEMEEMYKKVKKEYDIDLY